VICDLDHMIFLDIDIGGESLHHWHGGIDTPEPGPNPSLFVHYMPSVLSDAYDAVF